MAFIKLHIPCPQCGSSDGASMNEDRSLFCFVCQQLTPSDDIETTYEDAMVIDVDNDIKDSSFLKHYRAGTISAVPERRILVNTMDKYGVVQEGGSWYFPYYDKDNQLVAAKVRSVADKNFSTAGSWSKGTLFGQHLFPTGGKYLTITEGEFDALATFQMTGSKWPVVSIRNGAGSALKDCKAAYEYINSFENIVVCMDGDAPGQKAAKEIAELFGSKCKLFKPVPEHKDACDWLAEKKEAQFVDRWWRAEAFVPDGIVSGASLWDLVSEPMSPADCTYPWASLNSLTYGLRFGELVTVTAGSGLGKSQVLREIVWHLIKETNDNIGLLFLEESVKKTALSMMSLSANAPLHLPDTQVSMEQRKDAFENTLGTGRLYLLDHFGSTSVENIINRVRYMAKAVGCKYIFVDHISIIVSAQESGDERKAIDEIMTKLRMLVQETNISLIVVSHLKRPSDKGHEEGAVTSLAQLRGSGSIAQLSDMVIGLERNGQHDDPIVRNTTRVRVLKNRFAGITGPAGNLLYNKETGRMFEIEDEPEGELL
jgi:twinkle protein